MGTMASPNITGDALGRSARNNGRLRTASIRAPRIEVHRPVAGPALAVAEPGSPGGLSVEERAGRPARRPAIADWEKVRYCPLLLLQDLLNLFPGLA